MQAFLSANPDLEIDSTFRPNLLTPLLRDDLDRIIDCLGHPVPSLKKAVLFRETYVVACAPAFKKVHRLRIPSDLSGLPILSMDKAGIWWNRFVLAGPDQNQPLLDRAFELNHAPAIIHAAVEGMGSS
jgi:DNA-binding transcriptional LysR family regulator